MKYFKTQNLYKATNVTFNPSTVEAYSYDWWRFVEVIGGKVVFNNYRYSVTTAKHQSKVKALMAELGITIDIEIESPAGLQWSDTPQAMFGYRPTDGLKSALGYYQRKINGLEAEISKPRSQKLKNLERQVQIQELKSKIEVVYRLLKEQRKYKTLKDVKENFQPAQKYA